MKIQEFRAAGVYGYLDFNLSFRDDYTFLVGLNGSGKTSALRLIMALLTPNLADLASLSFLTASLLVADGDVLHSIHAIRTSDSLALSVGSLEDSLELSAAELTLLAEPRPAGGVESESPVLIKALDHPVSQFIMKMATPMFLGLDRRFISDTPIRDPNEMRRREFLARRVLGDQIAIKGGNVAAGLADVNVLVYDTMSEIREKQEKLDAEFRTRLLASAFDFKPAEFKDLQPPSAAAINQYRAKQSEIEQAVKSLQIPVDIVRTALGSFFERMNEIAQVLEQSTRSQSKVMDAGTGKRPRKWGAHEPPADHTTTHPVASEKIVEWMVNKPQVDRITTHLDLLASYNEQRNNLREPIDRFLKLLNQFLMDTGKRVIVSDNGSLRVVIGSEDGKSVASLSSGERQLVVMLGHLTLNKRLAGSGVFIIDEPELSLHISWQERFVDSVREANGTAQIVMATHSPAIILERDDHCESLDHEFVR